MEVKILGKLIGKASGWDGFDNAIQFYDYQGPIKEICNETCFTFDWLEGRFKVYTDDGELKSEYSAVQLMAKYGF